MTGTRFLLCAALVPREMLTAVNQQTQENDSILTPINLAVSEGGGACLKCRPQTGST
jgi:hypothetical protein